MKIREKIWAGRAVLEEEGPITIVVFGDSVTHGAFKTDIMDFEAVYSNVLRKKLIDVRTYMPVNMINAGIAGCTATSSISRIEKQVLIHHPDLVIVCFGLNDINDPLEQYLSSLRTIFEKCSETDVIFMTPNMFNTYVAEDTEENLKNYAAKTAEYQNGGKMDLYVNSAKKLAEEMNVTVCDCYEKWKKLSETQDITMLLDNRINHPSREMHQLFADSLFDVIFEDAEFKDAARENTMFEGAFER